ncbi:MAG: hypothetical protein AAGB10_11590 [Pseudomonadota bacterium]
MRRAQTLSAAVADARRQAEPAAMPLFHAACACGSVRFSVSLDPERAAPCICARCRGAGLTIAHAAEDAFRLLTGRDALTEPVEDALTPHHFFCGRCGEAVFGYVDRPGHARLISVNTACLHRGAPSDLVIPEDGSGE